jgi:dimethylhistidine N-methyltransferase
MNQQFAQDVLEGLKASPKRLPSKYFYNKEGDALFQAIMNLPEYYLTRAEYEALETNREALLNKFSNAGTQPFNLIEFGAGDGFKTKVLLKHFQEKQADFQYMPIDISANVLEQLAASLKEELPTLAVKPICNDYFKALEELKQEDNGRRNVVLFLGSNIGNFAENGAIDFLTQLGNGLRPGDLLLIGFDRKKNPEQILAAYNDAAGVTRAFNMNLLTRINEELGANFITDQFQHYPTYDPLTGQARSYLVSRKEQTVELLDEHISFYQWEPIHMEISRKYSLDEVKEYANRSGFTVQENYMDCKQYFTDSLWEKQ